jgi:recombinational DNA repair protein (RecF pathway)
MPEAGVLELVVAQWRALRAGTSTSALRWLELALLELTGHAPALDRCLACGTGALAGALFDPDRGGVVCGGCAARARGGAPRPFGEASRAFLVAVTAAADLEEARALDADPRFTAADRGAARDAVVAMLVALIGHPLRSLEYLAKLGAASRRARPAT